MRPSPAALRIFVYDWILSQGAPPTIADIASHFGTAPAEATDALRTLKIGKTILPHPETGEIWMAGPFSSAETPYVVRGLRTRWWANCGWDMLGVAIVAAEDVQIDARCTDCGAPMTIEAGPSHAPEAEGVVHFLVPARHWYDDVGYT